MATTTCTQSLCNNMLVLVFLLLARTGCDWVEISQNHYRKEPPRQITVKSNFEGTTEAIIVYKNSSLLDKHWKKGVIDRVPSVANIRRVHIPSVKTPSKQTENNIFTRQASTPINVPHGRYDSVIEKPNIVSKYHEEEIPIDPSERLEVPYHINRGSAFVRNPEVVSFHKTHIANTNIVSRTESFNKGYITNVKNENWNQDIGPIKSTYLKGSENIGIVTTEPTPQIKYQDDSEVDFNYEGRTGINKEQPKLTKYSTSKDFSNIMKPIVQSLPINNAIIAKTKTFIKNTEMDSEDNTRELNNTHFNNESDKNTDSIVYESNEEDNTSKSDGISNNTKGSTINTMWKLMKVVTDSIYKSTSKSFRRKINYLEGLRSNILSSIEDQVERTWPDDDARPSRRARDAAAGRGHVEFPSSESALMSISFLTFAVFLIKLVLQVIHTYKNKTMMVTPAVVTAVGRAAAAIKSNQQ